MTHKTTTLKTQAITSAPALAAAIRETHLRDFAVSTAQFCAPQHKLVQMYRVVGGNGTGKVDGVDSKVREGAWADEVAAEAQAAAAVVGDVAERLRRLGAAYGEWKHFDAPAYFDIPQPQADLLLTVTERVNSVYVHFQMDLLLPAFGKAEAYWANHFVPAYHAANIAQVGRDEPADAGEMHPHSSHKVNGVHSGKSLNGADAALLQTMAKTYLSTTFWPRCSPPCSSAGNDSWPSSTPPATYWPTTLGT
ncbi:MAG: hypothetical protein R2911_13745 [Caldilineaceae bacterium]